MDGIVKRIKRDGGFGFIKAADGTEYFFHRSAVVGNFEGVQEGQRVEFEEDPDNRGKGPRAKIVRTL